MAANKYQFDWTELAFGSKKALSSQRAIFIAAPRTLSPARLKQLIKTYLPKGHIVLGLAKEEYVLGLEGQPQFKMLQLPDVQDLLAKVNGRELGRNVYTLSYFQREISFILEKLDFQKAVLVNGSWKQLFHTLPAHYILSSRRIDYEMVSPFVSEAEAQQFEVDTTLAALPSGGSFSAKQMLDVAANAAIHSYDWGFQTGLSLGRKKASKYELIAVAFNRVVPYQTYAMHHGASRETNFSPMNDLNHYDTVHAEVDVLITAQKRKLSLAGTTLFINLLPCPTCARMFSQTDIAEFVYSHDHSDGYAIQLLQAAGKKVRRLLP